VVSEERGTISVVVGGTIRRDLDAAALKLALLDALEVEPSPERAPPAADSRQTLPARDE
jgi:hypothetical protein